MIDNMETRIDNILSQMTLLEKVEQLNFGKPGFCVGPENARLGIPALWGTDGPRGPRVTDQTVCFPTALAMAATWDEPLMQVIGQDFALKTLEGKYNQLFAPGMNMTCHPLAGRNSEYMGEDPFLAGKMAAAECRGLRAMGVVATIKHYACNEFETGRNIVDVTVPERPLRELYLEPFRICVQEGGAMSAMTTYNSLNGSFTGANAELMRIPREEWGFKGIYVSDWGAELESAGKSLTAGQNLELHGWRQFSLEEIEKALKGGTLKAADLDQRVREVLSLKFSTVFQPRDTRDVVTDVVARRALARRAATGGMVLLKNERGILPLRPEQSVALIGPFADGALILGNQGSSCIPAERLVTSRAEFSALAKGGFAYIEGCKAFDEGTHAAQRAFACRAEYFNNLDLTGTPVLIRTESSIRKRTFTGESPVRLVAGPKGNALAFEGQVNMLLGELPERPGTQDFAWSLWIHFPEQFPRKDAPFISGAIPGVFDLGLTWEGVMFGSTATKQFAQINWEIPPQAWAHVVISRKKEVLTVWINGREFKSIPFPYTLPACTLWLGGHAFSPLYSRCRLADVRIYDRALSTVEVSSLNCHEDVVEGVVLQQKCDTLPTGFEAETFEGITNPAKMSARWMGKFRAARGGRHLFKVGTNGGVRLFLDGRCLFDQWSEGMAEGCDRVIWPVLEAGRTYDLCVEFFSASREAAYCLFSYTEPSPTDLFAEARAAAKDKDVAIVMVGVAQTPLQGEGNDNESYELPGHQAELIRAVAAVNPNTVVVLCTEGGVDMRSWLASVPAVVEAFHPGQEAGNSLADILYGVENPSGKLPMTYVKSTDQLPHNVVLMRYPDSVCEFGYRLFDRRGLEPQFPFGHGLSYTAFGYDDLHVTPDGERMTVKFTITNTGVRVGAEVAQVYVRDLEASVERPVRELKGFRKILLQPGETRVVEVVLERQAFAFYSPEKHIWIVEPGRFEIEVGSSSRDIRLKQPVEMQ